ncbi:Conserved_hypothetical protein [Hexamita inflata]|uniref:Palmitoyltransferase n=1 Tax=Hexamita inflata TaxID=28002 RepID=A0AA86Q3Q0_9EUKA|nr:Conserved hypothetical protein [Hexamita inflata]
MSSPITFLYKYIDINQPSKVLIQVTKYSSSSQSVNINYNNFTRLSLKTVYFLVSDHKQLKRNNLIFSPLQIVFVFYQIYMMRFRHINALLSIIILFSNIVVILKVKFASGIEAKTSQRCEKCKIVKSKSQTHCKYCDVCVEEFDHHCKFLGACICKNNYSWFISVIICCLMQEFAVLLRKDKNGVVLHVFIYVYVQIIIVIHLLK